MEQERSPSAELGLEQRGIFSNYPGVTDEDLRRIQRLKGISRVRLQLAEAVESWRVQYLITAVIILNAIVLGLETDAAIMGRYGGVLVAIDRLCLLVFLVEIGIKLYAYRSGFWKSGWNVFDLLVVAVALVPGAGPWAVLRSLRVLRVLRLLTVVPALKKVVAAFIHSIPGLGGVVMVMAIFFYTAGVLATRLFGETHPQWFGSLGRSLYSLFQIMTLESWSMGIVRPLMEVHPWAWLFFVPFIIIATFTILNLFIGIIVSTMQELAITPEPGTVSPEIRALLQRLDADLKQLSQQIAQQGRPGSSEDTRRT